MSKVVIVVALDMALSSSARRIIDFLSKFIRNEEVLILVKIASYLFLRNDLISDVARNLGFSRYKDGRGPSADNGLIFLWMSTVVIEW